MSDCRLTNIAVIICACLACGSVDDKLYLAVCYRIGDVGSALVHLVDTLGGNACFLYHFIALACCKDTEAKLTERPCNIEQFGLISVAYAEENCAFKRKSYLCCFLCLVVSFAECGGYTEHLACSGLSPCCEAPVRGRACRSVKM